MSDFYAFSCTAPNADLRLIAEYGLDCTRAGNRGPIAVHMHPDLIRRYTATHGDWPAHWPPLVEDEIMERDLIGIEIDTLEEHSPRQLRLFQENQ